jgi:hypothetical protein
MSLKEEIELDILDFFKSIDVSGTNDRKEKLRMLLSKYAQLSSSELAMDDTDLRSIITGAMYSMSNRTLPMFLGENGKQVAQEHQQIVCIIESTVSQLNKKDCLKRLPKFDFKANKF